MIELDGNYLEGGGQIVRTALALSAVTHQPFIIENIRKGRKEPGLKAQHLHCIEALKKLCGAKAVGAELGSERIEFYPGKIKTGTVNVDIGTAGQVSLLLQAVLLPALFAGGRVRLKVKGGTSGLGSMTFDFYREVILKHYQRYGDISAECIRRGYYPKGGGEIVLKIDGKYLFPDISGAPKLSLFTRPDLSLIKGISHASGDLEKASVAERQATAAKRKLSALNVPVKIDSSYSAADSTGSEITLWAIFGEEDQMVLGADSIGERGKKAEIVGEECAMRLASEISTDACVDSHTADNLIPLIGLFGGSLKTSQLTDHALTNIYTVEKFLGNCLTVDKQGAVITNFKK